jgi:hypothetical protein
MRVQRGMSRAAVVKRLAKTPHAIGARTLLRIELGQAIPATNLTWALLGLYGELSRMDDILAAIASDSAQADLS